MAVITSSSTVDAGSLGRLPTKDGAKVGFGGKKREPVMGDDGVLGYTEHQTSAPYIKCTLVDSTQNDKAGLLAFAGQTVVLTTNNGQKYSLSNAWVGNGDTLELNTKEGTMEVEFFGDKLTAL
jgi:hypothetical protein